MLEDWGTVKRGGIKRVKQSVAIRLVRLGVAELSGKPEKIPNAIIKKKDKDENKDKEN